MRRMALIPALLALPALLLAACASHGSDPDQLDVVRVQASQEPAQPRAWRAALKAAIEGDAELELWLPLPAEADDQSVQSLVVEVGPPGVYALEEPKSGQRLLHVTGPPPRLSASWRAGVLQPSPLPAPPSGAAPLWLVRRADGSATLAPRGETDEGIRLSASRLEMRGTVGGAPRPLDAQLSLERVE